MRFVMLLLIMTYSVAFLTNVLPSLTYPDFQMNGYYLFASLVFLVVLLGATAAYFLHKPRKSGLNKIQLLSGIAVVGAILYYGLNQVMGQVSDNMLFNAAHSIAEFLFYIFVMPFFGINALLEVDVAFFALLTCILYVPLFFVSMLKKRNKSVRTEAS
ncbi:hypothetical protein [Lentibacillus saliphilus]|uniref:hypothetical protein n=1 Tax=Lentibacillus saliphilus TaxID=2737028 RepID=UPI001C2F734E|nr:hypothetical protein [Lentibacillus saliphilus]